MSGASGPVMRSEADRWRHFSSVLNDEAPVRPRHTLGAPMGARRMRTSRHTLPWTAAAVLVAFASGCGNGRANPGAGAPADCGTAAAGQSTCTPTAAGQASTPTRTRMPRLVDVGAGKCIPCKAMAPILAQLRTDFAGRMEVEFVDVWVNPDAGQPYGIRMIPTQIFYGADGRELSRHEGFMSREDILARWQSHGLTF